MFKGDTTKELKNLITHTLIAGVLIQASRFLTAVAIDISTVATYGIGGMPISILGNEGTEKELDRPLLGVRISEDISKLNIDLKSLSNLHLFMVTEDNQLISPCHLRPFTDTTTSGSETLII
ncbi:MAG: hypothetical protein LBU27_03925 [Candidatus Peribacteria bacterium]|jgi:hypothetical protein|nr:hypothetical protein [Candidatus Peribacteria bacterium]